MRKVLVLLPFACLASNARDADTCQDCTSTGKSSLLQKESIRDKRLNAPTEDSLVEAMRELPPDDDAELDKEVTTVEKIPDDKEVTTVGKIPGNWEDGEDGEDGEALPAFLGLCSICSQKTEAGKWELIPDRWAGRVKDPDDPDDGKTILWRCKDADKYMDYVARFKACPKPPSLWLRRCCQSVPTPAPTPAPTPPPQPLPDLQPPGSRCDICPGTSLLWHYYAGKDSVGLYNCARANRFANRDDPNKPTCQTATRWWSRWCCANKQLKCSLCPRGKRDLRKWIQAGKWTGSGGYQDKWVTCQRAEALLQQPHAPPCGVGRRPFVNKCCFSRR